MHLRFVQMQGLFSMNFRPGVQVFSMESGRPKIIRRGSVDKLIYPAITYIGAPRCSARSLLPDGGFFFRFRICLLFCCFPVFVFAVLPSPTCFISTPAAGADRRRNSRVPGRMDPPNPNSTGRSRRSRPSSRQPVRICSLRTRLCDKGLEGHARRGRFLDDARLLLSPHTPVAAPYRE